MLSQLTAKGIKTAFVPTFLNWTLSAELFAPFSYGFADWGGATSAVRSYDPVAGTYAPCVQRGRHTSRPLRQHGETVVLGVDRAGQPFSPRRVTDRL